MTRQRERVLCYVAWDAKTGAIRERHYREVERDHPADPEPEPTSRRGVAVQGTLV